MTALKSILLLLFPVAAATAATTAPTTAPVTQPTADNLEIQEWSVFVVDGSTGQLNPNGMVASTMPPFVTDHRYGSASGPAPAGPTPANQPGVMMVNGMPQTNTPAIPVAPTATDPDQPSPVGVIRLIGQADAKIDLSITAKGGSFLGAWPKAQERANQLLWRDLSVADQPTAPLDVAGPDNWFTALRQVKSAYVSLEHVGCEKFLTYDLQVPYPSPLKARAGNDFSVELSNTSTVPLHDLTLYQGDANNTWRTVAVGDLDAIKHPQPAASMPVAPVQPKRHMRLGVSVQDVSRDPKLAQSFGYTGSDGLIVQKVSPRSPSDGVLRPGDIITEIDGKDAPGTRDLGSLIGGYAPGTTIKLTVFRDKASLEVQITLTGQPTTAPTTVAVGADKPRLPGNASENLRLGIEVTDSTAQDSPVVKQGPRGLCIDSIKPGSPADAALKVGDVILKVDDKDAPSAIDFAPLFGNLPTGTVTRLTVFRGKQTIDVDIQWSTFVSRLGIAVSDISTDPKRAEKILFKGTSGLFVESTHGDAAKANINPGGVIVEVDGKDAPSVHDFCAYVDKAPAGASIKLKEFYFGTTTETEMTVTGQPTTVPAVAATLPAPTTAPLAGMKYQLTVAPTTQPADLAAAWKPRITQAGVDPADAALISRVIQQYAFDAHRLTAVYVMDDAEFDRLLPIEVVPQPAKITRFGLVIVINVDPSKGTVIDDLITQLGDNDWSRRDAAYHALAAMGPAASAKLTGASKNSDLEIAWRAERLLALMPATSK